MMAFQRGQEVRFKPGTPFDTYTKVTVTQTDWSPTFPYVVRALPNEAEEPLRFVQVPCPEGELEEI